MSIFVKVKNNNDDNGLVYIKSKNVNVFPCGRRRSRLIDELNDGKTTGYIPFDPEARLNTEANNRKHSGLNGFKQSYFNSWNTDGILSLVIAGYLFTIDSELSPADFGAALEYTDFLGTADCVYANIKLADVKLFSGGGIGEIGTEVLRDQSLNDEPATCLDLIIDAKSDKNKADSYYFSGLSLSTTDRTNQETGVVSLKFLVKNAENVWEIFNPARLPVIEHGDTRNSVKINGKLSVRSYDDTTGDLDVENDVTVGGRVSGNEIDAKSLKQNGHTAALLDISPITKEDGKVYYQLKFTGVVEN